MEVLTLAVSPEDHTRSCLCRSLLPPAVPVEAGLLHTLGQVPDPRRRRGVRYPLVGMLAVAVCAVLAGARSFAAIGEWGADLDAGQLVRLGLQRAPEESTLRKLVTRLDAAALDAALATWAWTRTRRVQGRRVIAIDGKTVRGARARGTKTTSSPASAPHLIAALDHATGVVLGQSAVAAKSNEIPAVRDLLASFDATDLAGAVITVDAMHTQNDTAQVIVDAGADYVFTVKANQPRLLAALKNLPWRDVPPGPEAPSVATDDESPGPSKSCRCRPCPAGRSSPAPPRSRNCGAPPPKADTRASRSST